MLTSLTLSYIHLKQNTLVTTGTRHIHIFHLKVKTHSSTNTNISLQ